MTHEPYTLEATHLRDGRWAVRPAGSLGTCGFYPAPWIVIYVHAPTAKAAVAKALVKKCKLDQRS